MPGEAGVNQRVQRAPGVMIWGCTVSNGDSHLIILPRKTGVDSKVFIDKILTKHEAWLSSNFTPEQLRGSIWVMDGAKAHTAIATSKWVVANMERKHGICVIGKNRGEWPPRSPDLNMLDWAVWNPLKKGTKSYKGVPHVTLLPARIKREWPLVATPEFVRKQMGKFRSRLRRVVVAGGGYID